MAVDVKDVTHFFQQYSKTVLPLSEATSLADEFALPLADIEKKGLAHNIIPTRFIRNCFNSEELLKLFCAHVTIIGCGGLGGAVAMQLARTGVGNMHLVDPDVFEEHNLNRQTFCTLETIGQPKAFAAAKSLKSINPALNCTAAYTRFSVDDLKGKIIIDCLDDVEPRLELAKLCRQNNLILIHGAVLEWYGRVATVTPQNRLFDILYAKDSTKDSVKAPRVLAPTVFQIASLQAAETLKHILDLPQKAIQSWIDCDLKNLHFENIGYCD